MNREKWERLFYIALMWGVKVVGFVLLLVLGSVYFILYFLA